MSKPEFVYTTYIETTPEKLWHALTDGDFTERYWFGQRVSRVTFDIEPRGTVVKLTVTHDNLDERGKTLRDISGGWPMVIASLKSILETGRPLPENLAPNCEKADAQ